MVRSDVFGLKLESGLQLSLEVLVGNVFRDGIGQLLLGCYFRICLGQVELRVIAQVF